MNLSNVRPEEKNAEAFVGGDGVGHAKPPGYSAKYTPVPRHTRKSKDNSKDESEDKPECGEVPEEEGTKSVAVADGPADEVGVGLIFKSK